MLQDLRSSIRSLRRQPGFVLIAVSTLALGIGANTAIFGVVRHLLLVPLPVDAPEELALVYWSSPPELRMSNISSSGGADPENGGTLNSNVTYPIYQAMLVTTEKLGVQAAGFNFIRQLSVGVEGKPAVVAGGLMADGRYFATLRLGTALGRPLDDRDDVVGAPPVAVISHGFWRRVFGGDPAAIGRIIRVNGEPFEVVGVSAPAFRGISRGGFFPQTEVTVPLSAQPIVAPRWGGSGSLFTADDTNWVRVIARVPKTTSSVTVANAMTATLRPRLPAEAMEAPAPPTVRLRPGARGEGNVRAEGKRMLFLLSAVVGVVLLIACMNLASLMLARGVARQREIAMRCALGATRWRLARQVLVESLVLALAGAAGGLVLTFVASGLLNRLLTAGLGVVSTGTAPMELPIDGAMLALTAGVATVAAVAFGLWPAVRLSRVDPGSYLKHHVMGAATPKLTVGRVLIALQIGASVPLVVGALLLLRTISNIGGVTLGFDPQGIALFSLSPQFAGVEEDQYDALYRDVLREVEAVPGVVSATLIENPLMSGIISNNRITVDGEQRGIYMNAVGPRFFETMGMRLIAGRAPDLSDRADAPRVGVVNEAAVRELFSGTSPIGRLVRVGSRDVEIIGVASDSRYRSQREDVPPTLFDAALQRRGFMGHNVVVKTAVAPARLETAIRRAVAGVDGDLPVPELRMQKALLDQANARERVLAQLLTIFGSFALLLASIGLHGVTAYSVSRRRNEIGVRVALGARPGQVQWLILEQVLTLAGVGLVVGVPLALLAGPFANALLYGVAPHDPVTIGLAAIGLLGVAVGAGVVPARQAARFDPLDSLRSE